MLRPHYWLYTAVISTFILRHVYHVLLRWLILYNGALIWSVYELDVFVEHGCFSILGHVHEVSSWRGGGWYNPAPVWRAAANLMLTLRHRFKLDTRTHTSRNTHTHTHQFTATSCGLCRNCDSTPPFPTPFQWKFGRRITQHHRGT